MSEISLLIIEDEIELLTLYYEQSTEIFDKVYIAPTIEEAKRILSDEWIDGLLLDHHLPDGTGTSFLDTINTPNYCYPCVVMTAMPSMDSMKRAIENHVFKFIVKPIGMSELHSTLISFRNYIERTNQDIELRSRSEITSATLKQLKQEFHLSEREVDVIENSLKVRNNTELAQKLSISQGTIKRHWHNIFDKTNLRSKDNVTDFISARNIRSYRTLL